MAKQKRSKPKYSITTLLVLLVLAIYYNYYVKDADSKPSVETAPVKVPAKKSSSRKKNSLPEDQRNLTVFTGKVIGIKDGDTYEILYDSIPERVRLADVDCPEKSQPFGKNARQYAADLCFGQTVTVTCAAKRDRYGRLIGTVTNANGVNVNEALVKAGFAWHYKQYSKKEAISGYEATAREKHLGLWADNNPTPPWDWRKEKRNRSMR